MVPTSVLENIAGLFARQVCLYFHGHVGELMRGIEKQDG